MKLSFKSICLALTCLLFVGGCFPRPPSILSANHFSLSKEQANSLFNRTSNLKITVADLNYWDGVLEKLSQDHPLPGAGDTFRLNAYFFSAIKAFADASFQLTSDYAGSIDPIGVDVVRLFYPQFQIEKIKTDAYSVELANILMLQIKDRFEKEQQGIYAAVLPQKEGLWVGTTPDEVYIPSMKPWAMTSKDEFKSPPPPAPKSPAWIEQLDATKEKFQNATKEERQRSLKWHYQTLQNGTKWSGIIGDYMNQNNVALETQLVFREKFYTAMMDALIAVFNDKFVYMVARPFMRDPNFKPLFTTPNHPSYPSAHSTLSSAAATVLTYYFPENSASWKHLATEAGLSRLWAGIHFPIDNEAGQQQGPKVAKAVLFR